MNKSQEALLEAKEKVVELEMQAQSTILRNALEVRMAFALNSPLVNDATLNQLQGHYDIALGIVDELDVIRTQPHADLLQVQAMFSALGLQVSALNTRLNAIHRF